MVDMSQLFAVFMSIKLWIMRKKFFLDKLICDSLKNGKRCTLINLILKTCTESYFNLAHCLLAIFISMAYLNVKANYLKMCWYECILIISTLPISMSKK